LGSRFGIFCIDDDRAATCFHRARAADAPGATALVIALKVVYMGGGSAVRAKKIDSLEACDLVRTGTSGPGTPSIFETADTLATLAVETYIPWLRRERQLVGKEESKQTHEPEALLHESILSVFKTLQRDIYNKARVSLTRCQEVPAYPAVCSKGPRDIQNLRRNLWAWTGKSHLKDVPQTFDAHLTNSGEMLRLRHGKPCDVMQESQEATREVLSSCL
jgi:hypothetical protein